MSDEQKEPLDVLTAVLGDGAYSIDEILARGEMRPGDGAILRDAVRSLCSRVAKAEARAAAIANEDTSERGRLTRELQAANDTIGMYRLKAHEHDVELQGYNNCVADLRSQLQAANAELKAAHVVIAVAKKLDNAGMLVDDALDAYDTALAELTRLRETRRLAVRWACDEGDGQITSDRLEAHLDSTITTEERAEAEKGKP